MVKAEPKSTDDIRFCKIIAWVIQTWRYQKVLDSTTACQIIHILLTYIFLFQLMGTLRFMKLDMMFSTKVTPLSKIDPEFYRHNKFQQIYDGF